MPEQRKRSILDRHKLRVLIEKNVTVPSGKKHSKVQEFAKRLGYEDWEKPSYIYNLLQGTRQVSDWNRLEKLAKGVGAHTYELLQQWLILEIFQGIVKEVNRTKNPEKTIRMLIERNNGKSDAQALTNEITSLSTRVYHVRDDSMEPTISKGEMAIADALPSKLEELENGTIYAVEQKKGEVNLRIVFYDKPTSKVILIPVNKNFKSDRLKRGDIIGIYRILTTYDI